MINILNVSKSFDQFNAVNDMTFSIKRGEIVGLLGPNGAGKTTTMRMITGYYRATSGSIKINDEPISSENVDFKKMIGYLPESTSLYEDMLVADFLQFVGKARGLDKVSLPEGIERAVTSTSLQDYYYRPISHLSKGYRQRVGLAATLIHDPDILILDEPTSGLDPNQIIEMQHLIKNLSKSKTIILSTHILSEVESVCERVIIINQGNLILDKPLKDLSLLEQNKVSFIVSLKGDDLNSCLQVFQNNFEGVPIEEEQKNSDSVTLKINSSDSAVNDKIFKVASDNKYIITELKKEESSLDDIFRELTRSKQ